jgi:hypothetical protein
MKRFWDEGGKGRVFEMPLPPPIRLGIGGGRVWRIRR